MNLPGMTVGRAYTPRRGLLQAAKDRAFKRAILVDGTNSYDGANTGYPKIIRAPVFMAYSSSGLKWAPCKRTRAVALGTASTALTVTNATHFQAGDSVIVGSNAAQAIVSINYSTNVITLTSAITWGDRDPVYVAAFGTARCIWSEDEIKCYEDETPTTYVDRPVEGVFIGEFDQDKMLGDIASILSHGDSAAAIANGLWFDDYATGVDTTPVPFSPFAINKITQLQGNITLTSADNGTCFEVMAAATVTLPALAAGLSFMFFNRANTNLTIAGPSSPDNIVTFNDAAADSVAYSTSGEKIGAASIVFSSADATVWNHLHLCKHTLTVA